MTNVSPASLQGQVWSSIAVTSDNPAFFLLFSGAQIGATGFDDPAPQSFDLAAGASQIVTFAFQGPADPDVLSTISPAITAGLAPNPPFNVVGGTIVLLQGSIPPTMTPSSLNPFLRR